MHRFIAAVIASLSALAAPGCDQPGVPADGGRERVPARSGSRAARNAHRIGAFVKHWGRVDPTGEFDDPANDGDLVIWRGEGAPQSP